MADRADLLHEGLHHVPEKIVRDDLVLASGQLAAVKHIILPSWAWLLRDESKDPAWGTIEFGAYVVAYRVTL